MKTAMGALKGTYVSFDDAQKRVSEMTNVEEYAVEGARVYLGAHSESGREVIILPAFGEALVITLLNPTLNASNIIK